MCDCSQRGVGAVAVCRCQGVYAVGRSFPASWRSGCVSGAGEAEYVPAEGADAFIDANVVVSAVKAATLLGWHPKHTGLVAEVSTSSMEVLCGVVIQLTLNAVHCVLVVDVVLAHAQLDTYRAAINQHRATAGAGGAGAGFGK